MKVAILGDSFIDEYVFGEVSRVSPEAPVPILDVKRREQRGGGAVNVANNLFALGVNPTLFTIISQSLKLPYPVVSPTGPTVLRKIRFIGNNYQLLRADEPVKYLKKDLRRMIYPAFDEFDLIAFVDYDKGIVQGGQATIVDSKKRDLSIFKGSKILKINKAEYENAVGVENFEKAFITQREKGIKYYEFGELVTKESAQVKEIVDVTGAGDTVLAAIIYCLVKGIKNPIEMMKIANKAAGIVIGKFGTAVVTEKELKGE